MKKSPTEGWFLEDELIRLDVRPTDKKGHLLGPGWAEQLTFTGPVGVSQHWPATDAGDGHYWVEIPFHARNPRRRCYSDPASLSKKKGERKKGGQVKKGGTGTLFRNGKKSQSLLF